MKKIMFLLLITPALLPALEAGGGISVFVPQSLYEYGNGSVSLEQSIEFDIGIGKYLSIPLGFTYNTNYGLMVDGEDQAENPWFYSDSILPYALLKVHLPLGPFYLEVFGGGGVNYNFTLRALEGNIEKDLSTGSGQAVIKDGSMDFDKLWGFGYLAGAGFGITFDKISIELNALFRNMRHNLDFSADYADFSEVNPGETYDPGETVILLMRGISFGISGSLAF